MNEIIFLVEEADEGGFVARALGESIFTQAEGMESLRKNVLDAVQCHFDKSETPKIIRLHMIKGKVIMGLF